MLLLYQIIQRWRVTKQKKTPSCNLSLLVGRSIKALHLWVYNKDCRFIYSSVLYILYVKQKMRESREKLGRGSIKERHWRQPSCEDTFFSGEEEYQRMDQVRKGEKQKSNKKTNKTKTIFVSMCVCMHLCLYDCTYREKPFHTVVRRYP